MSERDRLLSEADEAERRGDLCFRTGDVASALRFQREANYLRKMASHRLYAPTPEPVTDEHPA